MASSDVERPERNHRNAAAIAAFHRFAHHVRLRRGARQFVDVVLAPVIARSLERPHVVGLSFRVRLVCVEAVPLRDNRIEDQMSAPLAFLYSTVESRQVGKVVVGFDREHSLHGSRRVTQNLRRDRDTFSAP